ncbi:reverse transcriptase domain-containing protein [Tanacetum coccineum]
MRLPDLLRVHANVFSWTTAHITGVSRTLIIEEETFSTEHQLNVFNHTEPVKQKKRSLALERNKYVCTQVEELVETGVLREVKYQTWVSNPIIVKKDDGKWKLRIDFTNINKACIREPHPLPSAELGTKKLHKYRLKCFIDAYKGYHQIPMAEKDEEKTSLFTRKGVFCYRRLPFGLKNAGATYQRLIDKVFGSQIGRNMEVNADDMVIKSDSEEEMLADIKETLGRLRAINLNLNLRKYSFGVEEGIYSGHLIKCSINDKKREETGSHIFYKSDTTRSNTKKEDEKNGEAKRKEPELENTWKLFTDEASSSDGSGAKLMLVNPEGKEYMYALRFEFKTTNNKAEYEALIAGLCIAQEMQIQELAIFVDSQLVANQNKKADALTKLASMTFSKLAKEVLVEVIHTKLVIEKEITNVVKEDEDSWMDDRREAISKVVQVTIVERAKSTPGPLPTVPEGARFGRPQIIILDNRKQFAEGTFLVFCKNSELSKHSRLSITLKQIGSASKAEYQGKMGQCGKDLTE